MLSKHKKEPDLAPGSFNLIFTYENNNTKIVASNAKLFVKVVKNKFFFKINTTVKPRFHHITIVLLIFAA